MSYVSLNPGALIADVTPLLQLRVPTDERDDPGRHHRPTPPRGVVRLATAHGLTAMLSDAWPADVTAARRDARHQNLGSYLRALDALKSLGQVLSVAQIPWVVVKGPAVAARYYRRPDLRPFSDVDILVPRDAFRATVSLLEGAGGRLAVGDWTPFLARGVSEIPVVMPNGVVIDLHWHVVNMRRLRQGVSLDTDDFLSRATRSVPGFPVLTDVDCAVHLAWHAGYSGCTRLIWACDIEQVATRLTSAQADEFIERCLVGNLSLMVAVALDWTARAFPHGSSAALAGRLPASVWRRVARGVTRRMLDRPPGRRTGQFVTRSTRTSTATSVGAAVGRLPGMRGRQPIETLSDGVRTDGAKNAYLRAVDRGDV